MHPKFFTVVLIYLYSINSNVVVLSARAKVLCPIMCNCYHDDYSKLKKVECDGRKLINPNIDAPVKTEYLDLSNNMITTLDKGSFEGLYHLNKIHMYSNAIATIYSDTFLRLRKLVYVDLSDNRIEEIDERLFDTNPNLKTVILSYNKFSNLLNRPFLISDSIEILNLKKCQIGHIYSETFKHLPKLKALDLSANSLASVNVQHMKPLKSLNWLDLNGNPWKCDKSIEAVRQWTETNDIMIFLMECAPKQSGMFERMVEATTKKPKSEWHESDDDDDDNSTDSIEDWLIDNEENNPKSRDYIDPKHIHVMLTECQERLVIFSKEQKIIGVQKKHNSTKSIIFFFLGIIIGVLISASIFFLMTARKTKRKWEQRQYERDSRIVGDEINQEGNIEIISAHIESEPPLPPRRRRHPARAFSHPQRPKKSFFASLFERRRVYHRFHPPTLIRRLSRSNLFSSTFGLNRSESRPRLDRQSSRRQNNPPNNRQDIDQQRLLNSNNSDSQTSGATAVSRQGQRGHPRQNSNQSNTSPQESNNATVAPIIIHRKPETPPPTYTECIDYL